MSNGFRPVFTTIHPITGGLTRIERARGFLEAAVLSEQWVREMGQRALLLEAHHTTHIEGTRLTLDQSRRLLEGNPVAEADPEDERWCRFFRQVVKVYSIPIKEEYRRWPTDDGLRQRSRRGWLWRRCAETRRCRNWQRSIRCIRTR